MRRSKPAKRKAKLNLESNLESRSGSVGPRDRAATAAGYRSTVESGTVFTPPRSASTQPAAQTEPRIVGVSFTKGPHDEEMHVAFDNDKTVIVNLNVAGLKRLAKATTKQRYNWRLIGFGEGIHWPDLDEDISAAWLLHGLTISRVFGFKAITPQEQANRHDKVIRLADELEKILLEQVVSMDLAAWKGLAQRAKVIVPSLETQAQVLVELRRRTEERQAPR
jgi:Protein of unknown function (DUF2442)